MGYSTSFKGVLAFKVEPSLAILRELKKYLGQDMRDLDPAYAKQYDVSYIDLELNDEYAGLQWTGAEKTYGMVAAVNWLIERVRSVVDPDFCLTGELVAHGEDPEDRWILAMDNGLAVKRPIQDGKTRVSCPECGHCFELGQAGK